MSGAPAGPAALAPERRVLLIVYLFPPRGGVGVMRGLSFAKWLPKFGCRVWVVTARNASNAYYDASLLSQIPREVETHRTFTPELPFAWRTWIWKVLRGRRSNRPADVRTEARQDAVSANPLQRLLRSLATPDPQRVWLPWARRRAARLIRSRHIDTVVISVPPFSELALAAALKRSFPALRVITDFRDEWLDFTLSSVEAAGARQKRAAAARLEREAVEASDLVITVTESWAARMRQRYPDQPAEKFRYLPNGYDDDLLADFHPRPRQDDKLVMTYMGTAYARTVYSPEPFLDALDGLDPAAQAATEVRFVGRVEPEIEPLLSNRAYRVVQRGFLPQREAMRLLEETDVLLLFARDPAWQPAKLLEYVATRKPILAIAPPEGEAARVIAETGAGMTVAPDDPEAIRAAVRQLIDCRRAGRDWPIRPREDAIAAYSRSALADRLAAWIRELA